MAKATYAKMFETVSGALNKIDKKSPHAGDQKMVLATHRKAPTTSPDCSRVYLRGLSSVSRTTPPSAREMQARLRFKTVSQNVAERKIDLTRMSQDQQAFLAQKDQPGGIRTLLAWYWKQEGDAYDAQHNG